jgi:hypothetical protein
VFLVGCKISPTATQRRGYILALPSFRELRAAISVEKRVRDQPWQPMADNYFRKTRKFIIAANGTGLLKLIYV